MAGTTADHLEAALASCVQELRYESAVAACAAALLADDSADGVGHAIRALLDASDADRLFVAENVDDPTDGLCTRLIRVVDRGGFEQDTTRWRQMPWSRLPDAAPPLSRGEPFVFRVDELSATHREVYAGTATMSGAQHPIFLGDRWLGVVGFADDRGARAWTEELRLLPQAAELFARLWERREQQHQLEESMAHVRKRLDYERALADCSRGLLVGTDERALEVVLDALIKVTGARFSSISRNVDDPELGPASQAVCRSEVLSPGAAPVHEFEEYWYLVPWSRQPEMQRRLARGVPFAYRIDELGPTERDLYEGSPAPTRWAALVPIMMGNDWRGTLAFGYPDAEHDFADEDLLLFQTAADMVAAFWLRQEAIERQYALVRSKDEFVAAVSHELRTPLTTVVGLSEELRDRAAEFSGEERHALNGLIAEQAMEMADIVEDLLVAARGDIGSIDLDPVTLDLGGEVTRIVSSLSPERAIDLCSEDACIATADALRVRQILRNLITNAVRYGGPNVCIDCLPRNSMVVVAVSDDGPEIEAAQRERIFEPYQRAHTEPTQPASVGLGLTVSRRLARLMGGDLTHHRAEDRNVFELSLPATG